MEETVATLPDRYVRTARADLLLGLVKACFLANLYWLWLSVKLGSVSMFLVGIVPVSWVVTGPLGIWSFFFDVPHWVLMTFA
jgi:hypothetical protein